MGKQPRLLQYPEEYKSIERESIASTRAPIVRTYDALREHLHTVDDACKVATSGFFNPLHKNHISNIISSKCLNQQLLADVQFPQTIHLTVIVNGDWSTRKKLGGPLFMSAESRADIVCALKGVDLVMVHDVEEEHQGSIIGLGLFDIWTKGGDRDFASLPQEEQRAIIKTDTVVVTGVGDEKYEGTRDEVSSSKLRAAANQDI